MTLYNRIGGDYSVSRFADPRIVDSLVGALSLPIGSTLLDVGAGNGKYALALVESGFKVIALEPSDVMLAQAVNDERIQWFRASAESIPLEAGSANGAFLILSLHHMDNRQLAMDEIIRVITCGPLVIFTFEPSSLRAFWLADYFPRLGRETNSSFSKVQNVAQEIEELTKRRVRTVDFKLPPDLKDKFAAACWRQPEEYLKHDVRNGISSFSLMSDDEIERGLVRLSAELSNGRWDEKYGWLRSCESYDAGYHFIVVEAN